MPKVLKVDSSARHDQSKSRILTRDIAEKLVGDGTIVARDVSRDTPFVTDTWIGAAYTPEADQTAEQKAALAKSNELLAELLEADVLVLGSPIYNFGIPASLKAWFDQICRVGITFAYTEAGPKGLLEGKSAYIVITSGGVPVDSPMDSATPHLRQLLNFIGITDISVVEADGLAGDESGALEKAQKQIEAIAA